MKVIKNVMSILVLAIMMVGSVTSVNAQGEDNPNQLPPLIIDVLSGGNSTFPSVPVLSRNQTGNSKSATQELSTYLVDFNNGLKNAKKLSKGEQVPIQNDYNNILVEMKKDERYQLIKPYIDNAVSLTGFLNSLEDVKPQLLRMKGGDVFYARMSYSLQLVINQYNLSSINNGSLNSKGKGGPNPMDIEMKYIIDFCGLEIITGAAAGGFLGTFVFPGVGTTAGAVVGGIVGLVDCLLD